MQKNAPAKEIGALYAGQLKERLAAQGERRQREAGQTVAAIVKWADDYVLSLEHEKQIGDHVVHGTQVGHVERAEHVQQHLGRIGE